MPLFYHVGYCCQVYNPHIIYYLDSDPPTTPNVRAITSPGTYAPTKSRSYTWTNIPAGQHKFSVQLVNNNDTPLTPPVTATVSVNVISENGPHNAVIVSPRDGAVVPAGSVTISLQVTNFNIVNKMGQPKVASGEGHIIYYMDVTVPTTQNVPAITATGTYVATINTSYTWSNVTPGAHTFSAQLVENDNTPLTDAPVVATVSLTAK